MRTIDNIYQISTSRVSMWSASDKYSHVPFFRFKLKDHDDTSSLYSKMSDIIENFQGELVWAMRKHQSPKSSFIVAPAIYINKLITDNPIYLKEHYLKDMSDETYKSIIDKAVNDLPLLAEHIRHHLSEHKQD